MSCRPRSLASVIQVRFFKLSRNEAPSGRGHSFEPDVFHSVSNPLRLAFAFSAILHPHSYRRALRFRLPSNFASGEVRGFRVPCIRRNRRVRSTLSTGWASSVSGELADPELASLPFWPELISLFSSLPGDDGCEHSSRRGGIDHTFQPSPYAR
jgi:hypothetical protein